MAITFDRHPREILTPGSEPRLLTTVERKASLIAALGIDMLVVLEFTDVFSRVTAEDFVADVLVGGAHAVHAVMGANFTFGYKAAGTIAVLPEMGAPHGMTAEGVDLVDLEAGPSHRRRYERRSPPETSSGRAWRSVGGSSWTERSISGHGRGQGLGVPDREPADVAPSALAGPGHLRGRR